MLSNEVGEMDISKLSIGNIMTFKEEELDQLLDNIRVKIEKNRKSIEHILDEF